jgi:hypothetical protein
MALSTNMCDYTKKAVEGQFDKIATALDRWDHEGERRGGVALAFTL